VNYRVVVPHNYGPEADHALDWAATLVKNAGGSLVLLHVILFPAAPIPKLPMIPELRPVEDPDASLARLRATATNHGVAAEVDVFETDDAGPGIVNRAHDLGASLIVLGGTMPGRGRLSRAIRESVIDHVVWNAASPVVVVRAPKA
jgi:nucleotide-binding universal stress UspA family protein